MLPLSLGSLLFDGVALASDVTFATSLAPARTFPLPFDRLPLLGAGESVGDVTASASLRLVSLVWMIMSPVMTNVSYFRPDLRRSDVTSASLASAVGLLFFFIRLTTGSRLCAVAAPPAEARRDMSSAVTSTDSCDVSSDASQLSTDRSRCRVWLLSPLRRSFGVGVACV